MRNVWIVFVSTLAASILGGIYDYVRPFIADHSSGTMLEAWFPPGTAMYLMPWLFACGGLLSSIIAVGMCHAALRSAQSAQTPASAALAAKPQASKDKASAKGKAAAQAQDIPGMPGFDFDKAQAEIKAAAAANTPAAVGSAPTINTQPLSTPETVAAPLQEHQE